MTVPRPDERRPPDKNCMQRAYAALVRLLPFFLPNIPRTAVLLPVLVGFRTAQRTGLFDLRDAVRFP
jgi:hypothetical protein